MSVAGNPGNEALVRSFFATLSTGDLERVAAFFDDGSTWTVCATEIPGAGTHTGRAIIDEFLGRCAGCTSPASRRSRSRT